MRGPGQTVWQHEVDAADGVKQLISDLESAGITIHIGRMDDNHRRLLTTDLALRLKRHRLDLVRVLLAKQLVAEAAEIRRLWWYADNKTVVNSVRHADLLFSARAVLPPGYAWDDVTYRIQGTPVPWDTQLVQDGHGFLLHDGVRYDAAEAAQLIDENKGGQRDVPVIDEPTAVAEPTDVTTDVDDDLFDPEDME